ncbi:hypothetical protein CDL15_Pgr000473 [Punica granatum]|uniref:Uncharacterized protein n=1 Tax=Punica granatum TaxID=22663 RepID=A0A218W455_PUNGR|nr:hypothetical protein CDL15_Pgr000473 [Punica granatum]PKI44584.1 hypothetical protein CRG98_034939 [Punica granatum]
MLPPSRPQLKGRCGGVPERRPYLRTRTSRTSGFTIEGSFERRKGCTRSSSGNVVARITWKRVKNSGVAILNMSSS